MSLSSPMAIYSAGMSCNIQTERGATLLSISIWWGSRSECLASKESLLEKGLSCTYACPRETHPGSWCTQDVINSYTRGLSSQIKFRLDCLVKVIQWIGSVTTVSALSQHLGNQHLGYTRYRLLKRQAPALKGPDCQGSGATVNLPIRWKGPKPRRVSSVTRFPPARLTPCATSESWLRLRREPPGWIWNGSESEAILQRATGVNLKRERIGSHLTESHRGESETGANRKPSYREPDPFFIN